MSSWFEYHTYDGESFDPQFCDINGKPVERIPFTHPYSFDDYVVWKGKDYEPTDYCVYSDRIMSWDFDKFNKAIGKVWHNSSQMFNNRKPEDIQKFLSIYFNKKVKLTLIMEGCNKANGYPYWIFGYKEVA